MEALLSGLIDAVKPLYLILTIIGVTLGLIISAMPGLTVSLAIVLLLPFTFYLPAGPSMALLVAVFVGGMAGGAVPSILINIPGNPASIVTNLDGFPLALQGRAGDALGVAFFSSVLGGAISLIILVLLAPKLSKVALSFGAPELFALILFGLSLVCGFSQDSMVKGLISCALGLLFVTVGLDPIDATQRYTFGSTYLQSGIPFLPVMIGLFSIPEVLSCYIEKVKKVTEIVLDKNVSMLRSFINTIKSIVELRYTVLRASLIGTVVGIIPGTGSSIAAVLAYDMEKRRSEDPEGFGKGKLQGVSAPEAANSAITGGALVPMLTLGIPGDPVTAVMLGALMIQGLDPGPLLFKNNPDVINGLFGSFLISLLFTLVITFVGIPLFIKVMKVPVNVLMPIIVLLCIIGSYSVGSSFGDVWVMLFFGLLGFVMKVFGYPIMPLLLAIILGRPLETHYRMSLVLSGGNPFFFIYKPICLALLILTVLYVSFQVINNRRRTLRGIRGTKNRHVCK